MKKNNEIWKLQSMFYDILTYLTGIVINDTPLYQYNTFNLSIVVFLYNSSQENPRTVVKHISGILSPCSL